MPFPQPPNRMGRIAGNIDQSQPQGPRRPGLPGGLPPGAIPTGPQVRPNEFRGNVGKAAGGLNTNFGPEALAGSVEQLYQLLAQSPAFAGLLKSAAAQGQGAATSVASRLGQTGLSGSGVGAATAGLAQQLPAAAMQQARGDLFGQAMTTALQNLAMRLQALPAMSQIFYQYT